MAEAVGLAASILTLVGSATYIQQRLQDYKKGAQERKQLLSGVSLLKNSLDDLRTSFVTRQASGLSDEWYGIVKPLETSGIFQRIEDIFSEIRNKLEPKHTINKFLAQVTWPFMKEDVDRNIRQMRDLASNVSFVLQDVSLKLAIVTNDRVTKMDVRQSKQEQQVLLDWLSSMRFIQQQELEAQKATVGTCDWFLLEDAYQAWRNQQQRMLYCKAIAGAGKTVLASKAFEDLRHFTAGKNCGLFVIYCKYDRPDSHDPLKISGALLRQSLQLRDGVVDATLQKFLDQFYHQESAKPSLDNYVKQIKHIWKDFSSIFIVVDGLDEIKTDLSRLAMIKFIAELDDRASVMFTSRPLNAIDSAFMPVPNPPKATISTNSADVKKHRCSGCDDEFDTVHEVCRDCGLSLCQKCTDTSTNCYPANKLHDTHVQLSAMTLDVSARTPAIRTYVKVRIEQSSQLRKWISRRPGLAKQIENKVAGVAQKMFLLARLHMDAITNPDILRESDFDDALENLPMELNASYEEALKRVDNYGQLLLQIVACAKRSLSTAEIEHAIGINVTTGVLRDGDIIPAAALVSRCAGLVTIDAKGFVIFAHYTIAEYFLTQADRRFENGHADLAGRCLAYLQLPAFSKGTELSTNEGNAYATRLQLHPFLDYAAVHWALHAQTAGDQTFYARGLSLIRDGSYFASIVQALWYSTDPAAASWRKRSNASPVELAVFWKFNWLFEQLLRVENSDWKENALRMTPLMLTAQAGDLEMTRRVLEIDSSINAVNMENESALHLAIQNGHEETALLLLHQPGIDVNLVTGLSPRIRTPLIHAVLCDQMKVFKWLLNCPDVDVNKTVRHKQTVLHHVIYEGNEDALAALLAHGKIDLKNESKSMTIPLHEAVENGLLEIVRMLLDAGTDINIRDLHYNATALMRAADYGQLAVAEELIKRGADWDARDVYNRHCVHSAAINQQAEVAEYILKETNIDVNLQDVNGNTPLHDAAGSKDTDLVEVLVKHGARTDLVNGKGDTALDIAKRVRGAKRNLILLADVNETNHDHKKLETLLDAAEYGDESEIDSILTALTDAAARKKALGEVDVWLQRTPLHHVIQRGFTDMVPKLHEAGADIQIPDRYGRTPLHVAAILGRTSTAKYLLENGSRTDVADGWGVKVLKSAYVRANGWTSVLLVEYGSALEGDVDIQWLLNQAAWQGNLTATKRLVEAGARVDLKLSNGMSPYEYAKEQGHKALAEYLDNVGREAPTVRFEEVSHSTKKEFPTADHAPGEEITDDGTVKRIKRTGTDEVRMEQGQALEKDDQIDNLLLPRSISRRVFESITNFQIVLACLILLVFTLVASRQGGSPIVGENYLNDLKQAISRPGKGQSGVVKN